MTVSIADAEISEDGGTTPATISRTGTTGDLEVTLTSSDTGEAIVTATAIIPDGSTSVNVTITGVPDGIVDGTQTVTFTASAENYANGSDTVGVSDIDAPTNDFSTWISGFSGTNGQTALTDDPDGDGDTNAEENYFGTHPGERSASLFAGAVNTSGTTTFTFTHPINENRDLSLTPTYIWSTDLTTFYTDGNPNPGGTTVTFEQMGIVEGVVTVTATIEGTATNRVFVDVQVIE